MPGDKNTGITEARASARFAEALVILISVGVKAFIGFTEAGGKGGLAACGIQVGGVTEGTHAEVCKALLTLFRV